MAGKSKKIFGLIIRRLLWPHHLYKIVSLQRNRKKVDKVFDDSELKLYHQILKGDFLHYGYFEDTNIDAKDVSLNMIYEAQEKYGHNIVDLIEDTENEILDIGCGMGGLLQLMNKKGYKAIGLTPDTNQIKHIKDVYPNKVLEMKFEDLQGEKYIQNFGTVITSESLQYLNLKVALPLINTILKPKGVWIACDYFRIGNAHEKSGHRWNEFIDLLTEHGFELKYQKDITDNVLPTISYIYMWATEILLPVKEYALSKFKIKSPGFFYACCDAIPALENKIDKNIKTINPVEFKKNKKYVLMTIIKK